MLVLDTDCLSLLEEPLGKGAQKLVARLEDARVEDVCTTIINYEEQTRGWFAVLSKAKSVAAEVRAYQRLSRHLENYTKLTVLEFDDAAAVVFQSLRAHRLRIGTMDLKIAAIVIAQGGTLLTRNLSDFKQIPNLVAEDWTI